MESKYKQSDFTYEEDFIIDAECETCGHITEKEEEFEQDCTRCGGYLIYNTSHEDCRCAICDHHIDMWEDVYRHNEDSDIMICKDCYEEMEEE